MKIEEVFDNPKRKMNASRQESLGQHSSNSETNKENSFLVPLRLSSGKWDAKQHTQDTSARLSDLKTISTPDLFGRLEREMRFWKIEGQQTWD
uniref:Uncharacterized protein n=1 Tax=Ditylenchus dipsaci TaxID=166011 RepID=A0A915E548_9BILA